MYHHQVHCNEHQSDSAATVKTLADPTCAKDTGAFGDGATGSGATLTHTYSNADAYTAVVTAPNSVSSVRAPMTVTVTPAFY